MLGMRAHLHVGTGEVQMQAVVAEERMATTRKRGGQRRLAASGRSQERDSLIPDRDRTAMENLFAAEREQQRLNLLFEHPPPSLSRLRDGRAAHLPIDRDREIGDRREAQQETACSESVEKRGRPII